MTRVGWEEVRERIRTPNPIEDAATTRLSSKHREYLQKRGLADDTIARPQSSSGRRPS